jgi:RND family efflux transporter MFP subunit
MSPRTTLVIAGAALLAAGLTYEYGGAYWPQVKPRIEAVTGPLPPLPWEAKADGAKAAEGKAAEGKSADGKPAGGQAQAPAPGAAGQAAGGGRGGAGRVVAVALGKAERKPMDVRFDTIGSVQPLSTVTVRTRVESQIVDVPFDDGAMVKKGDVLFQLDSRGIEAQIRQADANLARSRALLEQAQRDVSRNEALAANEYASRQKLDDSRTSVQTISAQIKADEAALENLKVLLTYYTIRAPISGRVGVSGLKTGNIAKTGDTSTPLAVINQMSPIYVSFSVPQRLLPDLKEAMKNGGKVLATPQGMTQSAEGKIAVIDNAVDATSGTVGVRALFENADEMLWPGVLCNVRLVLRTDPDAVVVPREAVQTSQTGTFVFAVTDGVAKVRPVSIDRSLDGKTVVTKGLKGDETVVTDGQLLLTDGTKVEARPDGRRPAATAGAADPNPAPSAPEKAAEQSNDKGTRPGAPATAKGAS